MKAIGFEKAGAAAPRGPVRPEQGVDRMRDGQLRYHIGNTFPLAKAADAHRLLESRESTGALIPMPQGESSWPMTS